MLPSSSVGTQHAPTDCEGSSVGMFDHVRCRYPLPHHQGAEFQTKDILSLLEPHAFLGGALDDYEIMKNGRLRVQRHKRKWVKKPGSFWAAL